MMMGIMGLILAFGAPKIIQINGNTIHISLLNVKVTVGDDNKDGSQTLTVTPAKPESTATATNQPEAAPVEKTVARAKNSTVRRATPINDESDEPEAPQYNYSQAQAQSSVFVPQYNYSQAQAQGSAFVQGQNVSVQTSAIGGETRTRIVVNGRVIVDQ